jgi:glycosyltransferase involved in cell wall biosynthesis
VKIPFVSIVTPSYNSGRFIEETIQSVLAQNYELLEHIIIDGGSTDGTLDILKRYPHLIWISEPDRGQSDAINKGMKLARGDIIGWLNADDTYNPNAVNKAVAHLMANPNCSMVYSHCNHIDEKDQLLFTQFVHPFDLASQMIDFQMPQPTAFIKSDTLASVGYLNIQLHYVMDWDLFLRIGYQYEINIVNDILANFRVWKDTKTSSHPDCFWLEILNVFDRFFNLPNLPKVVVNVKTKAYARAYWILNCIYQATSDSLSFGTLNVEYKKALKDYSLVDNDLDFVIDQAVHWAIHSVQPHLMDSYVINIFKDLNLPDGKKAWLIKQTRAHLYASMTLLSKEGKYHPDGMGQTDEMEWLLIALKQNPRWILNRGIQSVLINHTLGIRDHKK